MDPQFTVVVVQSGPDWYHASLFEILASGLQNGTLEVVAVTRGMPPAGSPPGVRWVQAESHATVPRLRVLGVREARGSRIALTESFCVPAAGWAAAMLEGRGDAAVVGGPVSRRGGRPWEWAQTLIGYGRFLHQDPSRGIEEVSAVNVVYDAAALKAALAGREEFLEIDVHAELRRSGRRFAWNPDAVMYDASRSRVGHAAGSQFHHGRLYGSGRETSVVACAFRFLLTPLVPLVLLARITFAARRAGRGGRLLVALPWLLLLLLAWAVGEAVGYAAGEGSSRRRWQ